MSSDTWATVDGRPITRDAVERAYRRTQDPSQPLSDEETLTAKLSLLEQMIAQDTLVAKAAGLKIEVSDADLDAAYADAKKNIPDDQFQQELARRNVTVADMRESLRRDLLTQKVIDKEVGSKVAPTDKDVTDFFNANKTQFNVPEESYRVAQIIVTPVRDAQVANRRNDDATTPQAAATKTQMLLDRLKAGTPFSELAMDYSEDPESAPRGGDLGLIPVSRLKQAPQALRDAVLNKAPGTVNVLTANGAHTIVLVLGHEDAGQRDLSTPGVRDNITQMLRGRKEQLLRAAYLATVRGDARVVNYEARRVVESNGSAQSVTPAGGGR